MNIICPHCSFSKTVDPATVPDRPVRVSCPKCSKSFSFDKVLRPVQTAAADQVTEATEPTEPTKQVTCPACGLRQDKRDRCTSCGVVYAKLQARLQAEGQLSRHSDWPDDNSAALHSIARQPSPQDQPKAGFWSRVVAYMIDFLLLMTVQFVLSLIIGLVIGMLGIATDDDPAVSLVLMLFGVSLSLGYVVFFTGYCGQTPGKMALRIKVIRTDGSPMSYGRAVLREVFGKFLSSALFCIGYLMVAFSGQKQGLHDTIADTYVIKL